jgi:Ca-activated chloride channel homolog
MKLDANDPKWTAYALGEIGDAQERAEIESILEESEEMRRLVEEIRGTADLLAVQLRSEPAAGLTKAQRNRIERKANSFRSWFTFRPVLAVACTTAAIVLVSFFILRQHVQKAPQPMQVAENSAIPEKPAPAKIQEIQEPVKAKNNIQIAAAKNPKKNVPPESESVPVPAQPSPEELAQLEAAARQPEPPAPIIPIPPPIPPAVPVPAASFGPASAITGIVTDPSGGVIRGAKVTASSEGTNAKQEVTTSNAGVYNLNLRPGKYTISVEAQSFATQSRREVELVASSQLRLNFPMQVKEQSVVLDVNVQNENLILESGSRGAMVLTEDQISKLPLYNNNVLDLVKLMGGVEYAANQIFSSDQNTISGITADKINVTKDGISASEIRWPTGFNTPVNLSPEAVGEFKTVMQPVDVASAAAVPARGGPVPPPPPTPPIAPTAPPIPLPHPPVWPQPNRFNTEAYEYIVDNPFLDAVQNPLSTFSIDVDTASYSNMRRFLERGSLPPKSAIRIEELVNYFDYDYKAPTDGKPFAVNFELTEAPWKPDHLLLRIGLKGREVDHRERPQSNLVFLLDVSGSMAEPNKLPLVKQSMHMLLNQLTEDDRVSIVVYATDTRVLLPPTSGDQKYKIGTAIDSLVANGSTNGAGGIQLAYQMAKESFINKGVNRVILATDGDFNVGITNKGDLANLIEERAKSGIFLSALGFGMGNLKDATLEMLANKGRGNYAYIDTWAEAQKVLVEQMSSTLITIAKDVKIQVEFNPKLVGAYRLIGYEDKVMAKEDFNNDAKMASAIGAGHRVTALYELVPPGNAPAPGVDPLKYQKPPQASANGGSDEMLTLKIRSKEPDSEKSVLSEYTVKNTPRKFSEASQDFKFASAVAAFGMVLRDSPYRGNATFDSALQWAKEGRGIDKRGYRDEFIHLISRAISLGF